MTVVHYDAPPLRRDEILRYAGAGTPLPEILSLLEDCLKEAEKVSVFTACYDTFPVRIKDSEIDFSCAKVSSFDLGKNLAGAKEAYFLAATLGLGFDRLITRYSKVSPARAQMLSAIGTERIESFCDQIVSDLKKENPCLSLRPRFSPGYGDLPLSFQREIFSVLDCPRKIGLTLNESLLMSPTKSVTAIIGISETPAAVSQKCSLCSKTDCIYRRTT